MRFWSVLIYVFLQGHIDIDHDRKTLDLVVVPQHGSQNEGAKHILSGGERSYSTVAFLMSLWQVMEYPFYFLDEFDVFMVRRLKTERVLVRDASVFLG